MDERGYLRITDRKKDMFIVGGFNAYPAEIESLLLPAPATSPRSAVVGVPDERHGRGRAWPSSCRPPASRRRARGELIAWARDNMANFKVPRTMRFVDALPMNASDKVLKYELRARAAAEVAAIAVSTAAESTAAVAAEELRAADGRVPGRRGRATRQRLLECTARC